MGGLQGWTGMGGGWSSSHCSRSRPSAWALPWAPAGKGRAVARLPARRSGRRFGNARIQPPEAREGSALLNISNLHNSQVPPAAARTSVASFLSVLLAAATVQLRAEVTLTLAGLPETVRAGENLTVRVQVLADGVLAPFKGLEVLHLNPCPGLTGALLPPGLKTLKALNCADFQSEPLGSTRLEQRVVQTERKIRLAAKPGSKGPAECELTAERRCKNHE